MFLSQYLNHDDDADDDDDELNKFIQLVSSVEYVYIQRRIVITMRIIKSPLKSMRAVKYVIYK